jgi:hypothetical protein
VLALGVREGHNLRYLTIIFVHKLLYRGNCHGNCPAIATELPWQLPWSITYYNLLKHDRKSRVMINYTERTGMEKGLVQERGGFCSADWEWTTAGGSRLLRYGVGVGGAGGSRLLRYGMKRHERVVVVRVAQPAAWPINESINGWDYRGNLVGIEWEFERSGGVRSKDCIFQKDFPKGSWGGVQKGVTEGTCGVGGKVVRKGRGGARVWLRACERAGPRLRRCETARQVRWLPPKHSCDNGGHGGHGGHSCAQGGHCARKVGSERACLCGQQCPALEGMAGPRR